MTKKRQRPAGQNRLMIGLLVLTIIVVLVSIYVNFLAYSSISIAAAPGGALTGTTSVTVGTSTAISFQGTTGSMSFGTLNEGQIDDTGDKTPPPFVIVNDGNVNVKVEIDAAQGLWSPPNDVTSAYFQFNSSENEPGSVITPTTDLVASFTNVPVSPTLKTQAVNNLKWQDTNDQAEINIRLTVPTPEAAGAKSTSVQFTATAV